MVRGAGEEGGRKEASAAEDLREREKGAGYHQACTTHARRMFVVERRLKPKEGVYKVMK